jgi:hypothetical protein
MDVQREGTPPRNPIRQSLSGLEAGRPPADA